MRAKGPIAPVAPSRVGSTWFLLVPGTTSTARMPWVSMGVFLFGTFVVALEKAGAAEHEELAGDG